jgi:putative SOS response-associated peptidase YedK
MCGRFPLLASQPELAGLFGIDSFPDLAPRYNIAPTQPVVAVRIADAARQALRLRWGLIPSWAKDAKLAQINARSETAADKPMFRAAFRKRRCLIPASAFYEWQAMGGKRKQPFCIRLADEKPFAFAGLWERWHGPDGDVESCCILTTEANELVQPIHDRMPVIMDPQHFDQWLDPAGHDAAALVSLLRPFAAERMRAYPVSAWVNDPHHDDARCLEQAAKGPS